ncbi:hypothetical protein B0H14DRAFT_3451533 [Mycena olivaceomarginata]|nr:hypothetical protein B0H14DRAFT_3451533 [Mycena olivaceomarginata]
MSLLRWFRQLVHLHWDPKRRSCDGVYNLFLAMPLLIPSPLFTSEEAAAKFADVLGVTPTCFTRHEGPCEDATDKRRLREVRKPPRFSTGSFSKRW